MTDYRKINRLPVKFLTRFKKVVLWSILAIFGLIVLLVFLTVKNDYMTLIGAVLGILLTVAFNKYRIMFVEMSERIDKLK